MNPSRLEGVWINLQFANPATEGGGGSLQPFRSLWAPALVSLPTEPLFAGRGPTGPRSGRGPAARQPRRPRRIPAPPYRGCGDTPTWLALYTTEKFFFIAATVL